MPGEQVKILLRFTDFSGIYLNHCHNLEHEDLGMMRNYRIDP
jgi:FtsP/CotA-like multicopper oxidase with cupredoxin domain